MQKKEQVCKSSQKNGWFKKDLSRTERQSEKHRTDPQSELRVKGVSLTAVQFWKGRPFFPPTSCRRGDLRKNLERQGNKNKIGRVICGHHYTVRESNPGLARGRGVFYH